MSSDIVMYVGVPPPRPEVFGVVAGTGTLADFWKSQRHHPAFGAHPMHEHDYNLKFQRQGVPIFIHGDDVAAIGCGKVWNRAVDVLS